MKRIAKFVAASVLLFTTCWARTGCAQSQPSPPILGQLISVDGRHVHLYCTGHGRPTVVVASGGFSFDWGLIQPEIAEKTRICTYDPAGTAWSDPIPSHAHATCSDRVHELHELLTNAHIDGPYVLVGFSIGGLVARLYAARYPTETAGMVLVDHAFIDTPTKTSSAVSGAFSDAGVDTPPVLISKTPVNLDMEDDRNFAKLPERDQQLHRWALSVSTRPTPEDASLCFSEVDQAEQNRPFPLGHTPVAVVSTLYDSPQYRQLQGKLLALSHNSTQFIADHSTHMVIIDQPETVIKAIQHVLASIHE